MSRESYAREKFGVAVDALAASATSIQDRLFSAYMSFHPVMERDFSDPEDAALYKSIHDRLTAVKDGPEDNGRVKNTLNLMSDEDAEKLASDIVELDHSLRRK